MYLATLAIVTARVMYFHSDHYLSTSTDVAQTVSIGLLVADNELYGENIVAKRFVRAVADLRGSICCLA